MRKLENDVFCKQVTGENNIRCLKAKFDYLNARGVLDRLQHWASGETQVKRRSAAGRKRTLTSSQSYVLYKGRLRLGASNVILLADSLGISVYRRANLSDVPSGGDVQHGQASAMTDRGSYALERGCTDTKLGLADDVIVMYGDVIERPITRPSMLGSLTPSDYKSTNMLKYNTIVLDGGYIVEITQGYSGKTSDNQPHNVDGIAQRIAPVVTTASLLYDKGLNNIRSFAENGVLLLRPYVKEKGQVAASLKDARFNRVVASRWVIIENNCFADVRDQRAFNSILRIDSIMQMDLEATTCRVEADTRPRRRGAAEAWVKSSKRDWPQQNKDRSRVQELLSAPKL